MKFRFRRIGMFIAAAAMLTCSSCVKENMVQSPNASFQSIDYAFFDLKGNVSKVAWTSEGRDTIRDDGYYTWTDVYGFDKKGRLTTFNEEKKPVVRKLDADGWVRDKDVTIGFYRDKEGRIAHQSYTYAMSGYEHYVWENGRVKQEWGRSPAIMGWEKECRYDANGLLVERKYVADDFSAEGESVKITEIWTYSYDEFDDHGNWTKRSRTVDGVVQEKESRTIEYRH